MKKRSLAMMIFLSASALVFILLAAAAWGQPYGRGMMGWGNGGYGHMGGWGGYAMTQEQQATAQKLYADHYAKTESLRKKLYAKYSELNAAIYGGAEDKKIQPLVKEVSELRTKLFEEQISFRRQMVKEGLPPMGWGMGTGMGWGMMDD